MSIKCQQIIGWIEETAPKFRAENWDNVGLLVGDPTNDINRLLLTLDVTEEVVEEAIQQDIQLIVSHHPVIFKPLKNLRTDLPQGRLLMQLLKHGISVYSAHTNWDSARSGVNTILAEKLGLHKIEVLKENFSEVNYKIVVFVPKGHEDEIREALALSGAGQIGNYSYCTFQSEGEGTFKPNKLANPYLGEKGSLEKVEEIRLEAIVSKGNLKRAVTAMLKAHPYEEPAYDLIELANKGESFGLGCIGILSEGILFEDLIRIVKERLTIAAVRAVGDLTQKVRKIAVCGGSGGDLVEEAKFKGADVLITGDVSYHQALTAKEQEICVIDAGHYATEFLSMEGLAEYLRLKAEASKKKVDIVITSIRTDPWRFY